MLGWDNAVEFYGPSAVEHLLGRQFGKAYQMTKRVYYILVAVAGVALYVAAMAAAFAVYPHFWTNARMSNEIPWYFIGRTFVTGACALLALVVTIVLGALASARWGRDAWAALMPAILFLAIPVGQGVNVLLHTRSIWSEASASSDWKHFDEYLRSNSWAAYITLAITLAIFCVVGVAIGYKSFSQSRSDKA
jgi:hypothetical protein